MLLFERQWSAVVSYSHYAACCKRTVLPLCESLCNTNKMALVAKRKQDGEDGQKHRHNTESCS